ncbi:MAG: ribosome biogenesis GTP-binding protein YihA/YsxC [Clostridiales bacterium]|jgi:GTP-binding protein|nr:ribosome biogenesis GTP-binding protein YihA/YsxC [Clostridiales bacterium]
MNIVKAELAATAVKREQYPTDGLPEIAFVGKSNVGKSSLLNAMAARKRLARTSSSPGKTRTINFFNINDQVMFVDLPGYGYAKISRSVSRKWGQMVETYLLHRRQLLGIFMLSDIRHEPSAMDLQMFEWLKHYDFDLTVIGTKSDKLKRSVLPKHTKILRQAYEVEVLPFSAETLAGREELWSLIEDKISPQIL